ncbi:hypothetical protein BX600DRAFT_437224 [Xylariales sp. PMI_506]|nr:hypothetical protein BX600DRAFT_437224 [Xylariales sp. PMI_506]
MSRPPHVSVALPSPGGGEEHPNCAVNDIPGNFPHASMVRVAYQTDSMRILSPRPDIDATNTGDLVMLRIHRAWSLAITEAPLFYRLRTMIMEPVLHIGVVSTLRLTDVEIGQYPRELIFSSFQSSSELNAAFRRPEILQNGQPFTNIYPELVTGSLSTKYIVVTLKMTNRAMLFLIVTALLISVFIGLVVGLITQSIQSGFACFGGLGLTLSVMLGTGLTIKLKVTETVQRNDFPTQLKYSSMQIFEIYDAKQYLLRNGI